MAANHSVKGPLSDACCNDASYEIVLVAAMKHQRCWERDVQLGRVLKRKGHLSNVFRTVAAGWPVQHLACSSNLAA